MHLELKCVCIFSLHQQRSMSSTQERRQSISAQTGATHVGTVSPARPLLTAQMIKNSEAHLISCRETQEFEQYCSAYREMTVWQMAQSGGRPEGEEQTHTPSFLQQTHIQANTEMKDVFK